MAAARGSHWNVGGESCARGAAILNAMRTLAGGFEDLEARFLVDSGGSRRSSPSNRVRPGILLFPVRTPTKPPATHTNCYVVGNREVVIIDPASPYDDERDALDAFVDELIGVEGRRVKEIIASHLHPDHIGGIAHLAGRIGVPVAAHRLTAEALEGKLKVDRWIQDGERMTLAGNPEIDLRAVRTSGPRTRAPLLLRGASSCPADRRPRS